MHKEGVPLLSLCRIFMRIGFTSFGGFMTMVSVIQNRVVERHGLLSSRDVLDGVALASVLPGPVAINVVAYIGYRLRGVAGALVCVCTALLPACVLMMLFSYAYFRWGHMPGSRQRLRRHAAGSERRDCRRRVAYATCRGQYAGGNRGCCRHSACIAGAARRLGDTDHRSDGGYYRLASAWNWMCRDSRATRKSVARAVRKAASTDARRRADRCL